MELPNQKGGVAREIKEHDFGVNKASNPSPPTNRTSQAELWLVADKHFPPMFLPNKQHTAESFLDAVVAFNLDQARVKLLCFLALFMRILGVLCLSVQHLPEAQRDSKSLRRRRGGMKQMVLTHASAEEPDSRPQNRREGLTTSAVPHG